MFSLRSRNQDIVMGYSFIQTKESYGLWDQALSFSNDEFYLRITEDKIEILLDSPDADSFVTLPKELFATYKTTPNLATILTRVPSKPSLVQVPVDMRIEFNQIAIVDGRKYGVGIADIIFEQEGRASQKIRGVQEPVTIRQPGQVSVISGPGMLVTKYK